MRPYFVRENVREAECLGCVDCLLPSKRLVEQVIFESLVRLAKKFVNLPVVTKLVRPSMLKELK